MNQSKVSIITSSYNRGDIIGETAKSILDQEYTNWEWCIVDDHSTNNTMDMIKDIAAKDSRIKYFSRKGDIRGANNCRNQGADATDGEYLLFLDDDDLLEPFTIKQRVNALQANPLLDFGLFPSLLFQHTPYDMNVRWNIDKPIPDIVRQFNQDPICQAGGLFIKRHAFYKMGMFDATLLIWQDFDLYFKLYIQGLKYQKFFNLPHDLHIRHAEKSLSRSDFFSYGKQQSRMKVVKSAVKLLKENGLDEYVRNSRGMMAEVYTALLRTHKNTDASDMLTWALDNGVISKAEYRLLLRLKYIYLLRLDRVKFGQTIISDTLKPYSAERTIGVIPYK